MLERMKTALRVKLGKISPEELTVQACIRMGMKVGAHCHGLAASTIDYAHCWLIEIGDHVTFAPQVYLLAHDASTKMYLDYTKIARIRIEDHVFVGARALIMPGVTIGRHSIVAAGSVVTRSVPEGCVVAGNPAQVITSTEAYIGKHRGRMQEAPVYDGSWTLGGQISPEKRASMSKALDRTVGYVK